MSIFLAQKNKNYQIGEAYLETPELPLDPWSSVFIAKG